MTDFELMGLALEEARQGRRAGRGAGGRGGGARTARWSPRPTTPARPRKTPCTTQSCRPLPRPAARSAAGGCGSCDALSSRSSPAPCAPEPSSTPASPASCSARRTRRQAACGSVTDLFALPFNHHPVVEKRAACRDRSAGSFCRRFLFPCGKSGRAEPPLEAPGAPETGCENNRKNSGKLREKVAASHFLFELNCGILFNGILSKPIVRTGLARQSAGPLTGHTKRNAAPAGRWAAGHLRLRRTSCRAENTNRRDTLLYEDEFELTVQCRRACTGAPCSTGCKTGCASEAARRRANAAS